MQIGAHRPKYDLKVRRKLVKRQRSASVDQFSPSSSPVTRSERVRIKGEQTLTPEQTAFLTETAERAVDAFQTLFGETSRPLTLDVDPKKSLRVGYNVDSDSVNFPKNSDGVREGLASRDIITHETFHALLAQKYPEYNTDDMIRESETVRLHEALADYFTHQLYPDNEFAEDRRGASQALRNYRNSRRVSLCPGGHSQGNAITSYLLKNAIEPPQIRRFLEGGEFSLQALANLTPGLKADLAQDASLTLSHQVENYPNSSLNKYRLEPNKPLLVDFRANEPLLAAHPGLNITWMNSEGLPPEHFNIAPTPEGDFSVTPKPSNHIEKVLAVFRDGEEIIGSRPFYFGTVD